MGKACLERRYNEKIGCIFLLTAPVIFFNAESIEIPICTAPGDQLYPDVCWDGEAFWVVWQDEELGTIRGVRVNEEGEFLTDKLELLPRANDGSGVCLPCVAAGGGRIGMECRIRIGHTEFGEEAWGVGHNEFDFYGKPLHNPILFPGTDYDFIDGSTPSLLFGGKHFYSIHKRNYETHIDLHSSSGAFGFDSLMYYTQVWQSSAPEIEFFPPVACWDGSKIVIIYHSYWEIAYLGALLNDSIVWQGLGENFKLGRSEYRANSPTGDPKYQSLINLNSRFFFISEARANEVKGLIGYDIFDSTCMPIKDSATLLDFNPQIKCWYPDAVSDGNNFIAVWENRFQDETVHLYAIEVDTLGEILKSGYVVWEGPSNQQPALAYGAGKFLLTWSDNRNGDFNIRGMFFDTLEVFESIEEKPQINQIIELSVQPILNRISVSYALPQGHKGTLTLFDLSGRRVDARQVRGYGSASFNTELAAGVYIVRLEASGTTLSRKVVVVR
ncbi:T9SS type A sorting domain-containing protein [candidate division WOR-3 bacterium]|nr:T9SS type A sorting domain-containing protein [candidate division WOR-3 bacterium]